MICKNCSANIDENTLQCPYCGAENIKVAQKQHEQYVKTYKRKKRELKKAPEKFVKKVSKNMLYLAGGLFGVIILALIVVVAFSKFASGDMLAKQEKELAKLESYYAAGDYDSMCSYLETLKRRGGKYQKYQRIYDLYTVMDWKIETLKSNLDFAGTVSLEAAYVEADLERCIEELAAIREMEKLEFPYGEKEGAIYIRELYIKALKQYAFLTDAEIDSAVLEFKEEGNDYLELAEISIQRMEEYVQ